MDQVHGSSSWPQVTHMSHLNIPRELSGHVIKALGPSMESHHITAFGHDLPVHVSRIMASIHSELAF